MLGMMPSSRSRTLLPVLAAITLAVAGCGSGDDSTSSTAASRAGGTAGTVTPKLEPVPSAPGVDPASARVVRDWVAALRGGDAARAANFFAVPTVVSNGSGLMKLRSRSAVLAFNRGLPCGARMIAARRAKKGFLIATFVLMNRHGGGRCDIPPGSTARTAFRVRGGRITDWIRVADLPKAPQLSV